MFFMQKYNAELYSTLCDYVFIIFIFKFANVNIFFRDVNYSPLSFFLCSATWTLICTLSANLHCHRYTGACSERLVVRYCLAGICHSLAKRKSPSKRQILFAGRTHSNRETTKDTNLNFVRQRLIGYYVLYGFEDYTMRKSDWNKFQMTEMKYLRAVKGCTRIDSTKSEIGSYELNMFSVHKKITFYRNNEKSIDGLIDFINLDWPCLFYKKIEDPFTKDCWNKHIIL